MLNPSGHTVYKIMYKFETRAIPIWCHFSHHFFNILLTFLIDLILDTFSNILNRIQVRTIGRLFQYGHIFTPEPLFVRFTACFRSIHQKCMRINLAIYVSLHSAGLNLLIISCFNLLTPNFFLLLTSSANHLWSAASKILAYQHLSGTVFPPLLWWIVQL